MEKNLPALHYNHNHFAQNTKLLFRGILPVVLISGSLVLLVLQITGWSIILGLPMLVIGVTFAIFTYDEMAQKSIDPYCEHVAVCSKCGQLFLPGAKDASVCKNCSSGKK